MPKIEILAYSPINNMDEFIDFCIKGKPTEPSTFGEVRGVMSWLHGREVPKAQFFHTPQGHRMKCFIALVQKPDDEPMVRPWFETIMTSPPKIILDPDIPGINKQLRFDGQFGMLENFLPISELLAAIGHDTVLDAKFDAGRARVLDVLKRLDPAGRKRFLAALRSDRGSNPTEVFKELNFSLPD